MHFRSCHKDHVSLFSGMSPIHFVLLPLALSLVACGPSAEQIAAETKVRRLGNEVEDLERKVNTFAADQKKGQEALAKATEDNKALAEQLRTAEKQLEESRKKSDELQRTYDDYKEKYKTSQRGKIIGQKFAQLSSTGGRVFKEVSVLLVTPGEMRFRHAGGSASLPLGELEEPLRDRVGYDAEEASAWLASENAKKLALREKEMEAEELSFASSRSSSSSVSDLERGATYKARQLEERRRQLTNLMEDGRRLKADRNACPVHKKSVLASMGKEAVRLRQEIAKLSSSN